jgi:putative DNA methylase
MRDEAKKRIGHLYPDAVLPDGSKAPVIAWIWARTVTCPNPACGIEMPLVRSWWLGKKKGKEAYVVPQVVRDRSHPSGKRVDFTIGHTVSEAPTSDADGTVGRTGATCVACASAVDLTYIRTEGRVGRLGAALMAVVADGRRGRLYLCPDDRDVKAANVPRPGNLPSDLLSTHPQYMGTPRYGLTTVDSLFTARQLTALATLTDLVHEVGVGLGRDDSTPPGYSDAVSTYLGLSVSKLTNVSCTITTWMSDRGAFREAFARQALPMTWDYAESNPFHTTGGSWLAIVEKAVKVVEQVPAANPGIVVQTDARPGDVGSGLISTDPPYYDNIRLS